MSAEQNDIVVWGCNTPRTFRVYWALHYLGVDYEARPIKPRTNDMEQSDFLEISPGKKIPAFEHGPLRLVECAVAFIVSLLLAIRAQFPDQIFGCLRDNRGIPS